MNGQQCVNTRDLPRRRGQVTGEGEMTASEAMQLSVRFTWVSFVNFLVFVGLSLVFAGLMVLSPDINETAAYAHIRKIMAIGYTLVTTTLLLVTLQMNVKSNAALALAGSRDAVGANADAKPRLYRPTSALWPLFFMVAIIIVVNFIILIYEVDGGLF